MLAGSVQFNDTIRMANDLLKNPALSQAKLSKSFEEVLENQAKEEGKKVNEKASELVEDKDASKKKRTNEKPIEEFFNNAQAILKDDRSNSRGTNKTYSLLEHIRENKKNYDEPFSARQQAFNNSHNVAGQALIQQANDQGQRRMSKSQVLSMWERYSPVLTEDITKRSIRLDIPLIDDIQALVLRMHPDKSVTASLLGSKELGELVQQNKEKLNRNLKHHHLSLKEFNTYTGSPVEFDIETGSKKQKKQTKNSNKGNKKSKGIVLM